MLGKTVGINREPVQGLEPAHRTQSSAYGSDFSQQQKTCFEQIKKFKHSGKKKSVEAIDDIKEAESN